MPVNCPAVYVLWEGDGDSIEAPCRLDVGHEGQHESEVEGRAAFADDDLSIEISALVCWPLDVRVRRT